MKISQNKQPSKAKLLLIIGGVVIVLTGLGISYFFYTKSQDYKNAQQTKDIDNTSGIKEDQVPSEGTNQPNELPSKDQNNSTGNQSSGTTETPSTPPEKPDLVRADQSGSSVKIVANFAQSSPGYCEARFTKSGSSDISKTTQIVIGPSYYTCTFVIPSDTFISKGDWNVVVIHHVGNATTSSDSKSVEVN